MSEDTSSFDAGAGLSSKIVHARSFAIAFNLPKDHAEIIATHMALTREPVAYHTLCVVLKLMLAKATDRYNTLLAEAVTEALAAMEKAIELQGISGYEKQEAFGSMSTIYAVNDLHLAPAFARLFAEVGAPYLQSLGYSLQLTDAPSSMSVWADRTRLAQLIGLGLLLLGFASFLEAPEQKFVVTLSGCALFGAGFLWNYRMANRGGMLTIEQRLMPTMVSFLGVLMIGFSHWRDGEDAYRFVVGAFGAIVAAGGLWIAFLYLRGCRSLEETAAPSGLVQWLLKMSPLAAFILLQFASAFWVGGSSELQRRLSLSYDKLGDVREAKGNLGGAVADYQAGLAIRERLAARDPSNSEWQRDLIESHRGLAELAEKMAKRNWAREHWQRALEIATMLQDGGWLEPGDADFVETIQKRIDALAEPAAGGG